MRLRDFLARARTGPHITPAAPALPYNRLCHLADFAHPELNPVIRAIFPHEIERFGPEFPVGHEYRKHWEVGMAVRTLADLGVLHNRAEVLGVGAGNEPTIFHLTRRVRRVFATDLYLQDDHWKSSAAASMLTEPGRHWPSAWNPRRLVAQHMNALELRYDDASFDGVFSSSSIEHFGTPDDVRRAMAEIFRVLKPSGVLSLSTEFRLDGPGPGLPRALLFDEAEVRSVLLGDLPWEPAGPIDLKLDDATRRAEVSFGEAGADVRRHLDAFGALTFHRLEWSRYPHVVLREGDRAWTSLHLALRKPGRRDAPWPLASKRNDTVWDRRSSAG
jgi:SAM-dependent methyltransferase